MSLPDNPIIFLSCPILVYCLSCYLTLKEKSSRLGCAFQTEAKKSRTGIPQPTPILVSYSQGNYYLALFKGQILNS